MNQNRRNILSGLGGIFATAFVPMAAVAYVEPKNGFIADMMRPAWLGKPRIPENWQKWAGSEFIDVSEELMTYFKDEYGMSCQEIVEYVFDQTPEEKTSSGHHETVLITRPFTRIGQIFVVGFHRGTDLSKPGDCKFWIVPVDKFQDFVADHTVNANNLSIRVNSDTNTVKYAHKYIKQVAEGDKFNSHRLFGDK